MKTILCIAMSLLFLAGLDLTTAQPVLESPTDQTASLNGSARFLVRVISGSGPYTYAWYHDDVLIDPVANTTATSTDLIVRNVTLADAGGYRAMVQDATGGTASETAMLEVDPTFTKITEGEMVTDSEASVTATWIDYDWDGDLDLFVGNAGQTMLNALYRNNGDGSFTKIADSVIAQTAGNAWGVGWADYDNDGKPDLFVGHAQNGRDVLFHNDGNGQFTRANAGPMVIDPLDSIVPLWGDYDRDGFVDVFLSTGYWSGSQPDRLYHNEGNGVFSVVGVAEAGDLVAEPTIAHAFGWNDYDSDGDLDLFVAYTSTSSGKSTNYVFRSSPGGPFERIPLPVLDVVGQAWGTTWGDYDNDGHLDVFMPGWVGANGLFRNVEGTGFEDVSESAGLRLTLGSNGSAFADYDNDGWLDLCVANYVGQPGYPGGNAVFHNNRDGTFTRLTSGSFGGDLGRTTAVACGDYDDNGFPDFYFVCGDGVAQPNYLYRNNGNGNHWLKVKLESPVSNRLGIGAKIRVLAQIGGQPVWQLRVISGQHSWVSENGLIAHFGLGDATIAELIRIEWPSGNVQELKNQSADRLLTARESTRITPTRPSRSLNDSITLTVPEGASARQWYHDGVLLEGEVGVQLAIQNLQTENAGHYSVVEEFRSGSLTNHVFLRIDPTFAKITASPVVTDADSTWGGSWVDMDQDRDLDLVAWNGADGNLGHSVVYGNDGSGNFTRLSVQEVGDIVATAGWWGAGVWGDLDNDGDVDCVATDYNLFPDLPMNLFLNDGQGVFLKVTGSDPLVTDPATGYGALADFDNDGWLDVFVASAWSFNGVDHNRLYRGIGGGRFERVTSGPIVSDPYVGTEGQAWGDYDGDGDLDLVVTDPHAWWRDSNAFPLRLYRNEGAGRFTRITGGAIAEAKGAALIPAWADHDNDGDLDLFVSNYDGGSWLFHNHGHGEFSAQIIQTGPASGYPAWGDYDNDGDQDLMLATDQGSAQVDLCFRNEGGQLLPQSVGSPTTELGRTGPVLWGDCNNDGFLDLFIGRNAGETNSLFVNRGNENHWIMVDLKGTTSNRSAIGAKVRVVSGGRFDKRFQLRELSGGNRFQGDPRAHFGLGSHSVVTTLRIEWPSGIVQQLENVPADQILEITEPQPISLVGLPRAGDTLEIQVQSQTGLDYVLQVSDDLVSWTTVGTEPGTGGALQFQQLPVTTGARFYRVYAQ